MKISNVVRCMFRDVLEVAVETATFLSYLGAATSGGLKVEGDPQCADHRTEKPSYEFMLKVTGVTYDVRQDIIRDLKIESKAVLVHAPTVSYPYQTDVVINGKVVGHIPDTQRSSMAKMLLEKERRGRVISIPRWFKVGGHDGLRYGLRVIIKVEG